MSFLGFPNPSCPCIDPWSSSSSSSGAGPLIDMNFMEHPFNATRNNMTLSVDSAFGTTCNSWWNEALQDDCRNNNNNNGNHFADERCFSRWCFVDPDVCSYSFSEFGLVDTKKTFISYEACGNLFSYQFESKYSHLKDSTVYISYPPVQNDIPYQYTRKDGTISGAVPEYIKHVFFQRMNINQVVFREVSQASLDRYGSKFTACVHDVAVGRLDMCIGAFFRTTERLLLSGFTTSFLSGKQILVVKSQHQSNDNSNSSKNGFWGLLLLPFGVFTIDAWVIMALACLYMAFAYRVIQRKIEGKLLQSPLEEFGHAAYDGVVNITSGSVALAPRKPNCEEKVSSNARAVCSLLLLCLERERENTFFVFLLCFFNNEPLSTRSSCWAFVFFRSSSCPPTPLPSHSPWSKTPKQTW